MYLTYTSLIKRKGNKKRKKNRIYVFLSNTFSITTGYRGFWDCLSCIMFAVPSAGMSAFQAERGRKKQTVWVYEGVGEYLREEKLFQNPQYASVEVSLADPSHTGKSCCKGK